MASNDALRTVAGTLAALSGLAAAAWGFATLWTYQLYVTGLGSFTSRFAWRSLTAGLLEEGLALGLVVLAAQVFGSRSLQRLHAPPSD